MQNDHRARAIGLSEDAKGYVEAEQQQTALLFAAHRARRPSVSGVAISWHRIQHL